MAGGGGQHALVAASEAKVFLLQNPKFQGIPVGKPSNSNRLAALGYE